jgi:branched-chain amino acid transport system ATP-binding protein
VLRVEEIDVFYGEVQAVFGVSFEVNEGEVVSLIGANGAGKTTTLKAISGLLTPTAGSITFLGKRMDGKDPDQVVASGISMVPEGRRVFPYFSVYENLLVGACSRRSRGVSEREIRDDIEEVFCLFPRLRERTKQKAWSLSGGEQQMLAIARGLMAKPKLLLLDEPSLGLAPLIVRDVFESIKEIAEQGTTVLLVEQNANIALGMSDRAYVIETGRTTLEGTGQELRDNAQVRAAYLGG